MKFILKKKKEKKSDFLLKNAAIIISCSNYNFSQNVKNCQKY